VLIKSNIANVYSESKFIEDFLGDELAIKEEGFMLATFQTCLAYVCCMDMSQISQSAETLFHSIASESNESIRASDLETYAPQDQLASSSPLTSPPMSPPISSEFNEQQISNEQAIDEFNDEHLQSELIIPSVSTATTFEEQTINETRLHEELLSAEPLSL